MTTPEDSSPLQTPGETPDARGRAPRLEDVAKLAGVHPSTASRSMSRDTNKRISPATRARVLDAARELGYSPDLAAASLRTRRTMTVGVVIPDFNNPIWASLLTGIGERLQERDYTPVIVETKDDQRRFDRALEILTDRRVDGVIHAAARLPDKRRVASFARRTPTVLTGRDLPSLSISKVLVDDFRGGQLAIAHLQELGHRRIVQICGPDTVSAFNSRSAGAQSVADASGALTLRSTSALRPSTEEAERAVTSLLAAGEEFSAIFTHNDQMAVGATEAVRRAGLRCPEDISIVGYNDNPLTQHLSPPLTTISLPFGHAGRLAADMLLANLHEHSEPAVTTLQPTLVVRGSAMEKA